jgi:5-(carboxyamino)imidazole ribonucleotide mutase
MSEALDVAVLMGSDSDWPYVEGGVAKLKGFGLSFDVRVISAHRTPERLVRYIGEAEQRGCQVFIAAAGWSAALAGIVAAHTLVPVIGVPIPNSPLNGLDAILSTVQMPGGVPVATMSLGKAGASNAAIFAAKIIGLSRPELRARVEQSQLDMRAKVMAKDEALQVKVGELS